MCLLSGTFYLLPIPDGGAAKFGNVPYYLQHEPVAFSVPQMMASASD